MVSEKRYEEIQDRQKKLAYLRELGFDELINPLLSQQHQMTSKFSQIVTMLNLSSAKGHNRIYAVCIARRFFNLLYGWEKLKEQELDQKVGYASNVVIVSENGILSYADEIARYYVKYNEFPRIVIYDDMVITGDKLGFCVTTLADAICWQLGKISSDVPDQRVIVDRLMKDITMLVLGKSIIQEDIPLEAQRCILAYQRFDTDERHQVSRSLTEITNYVEVANTTYAISAIKDGERLPDDLDMPVGWKKSEANFDGCFMKQYEFQLANEYQKGPGSFFTTVREYSRNGRVFYSPLILHQECKAEGFQWLGERLAMLLWKKDLVEMAELLDYLAETFTDARRSFMAGYTFQLVEMILGQMLLDVFLKDFKIEKQSLEFDTVKELRNFGKNLTEKELSDFIAVDWSREELQDVLTSLSLIQSPIETAPIQDIPDNSEAVNIRAANGIYQYAIRTKKEQLDYKQQRNNSRKSYIQMHEYCKNMEDRNKGTIVFESEFMHYYYAVSKGNLKEQSNLVAAISLMTDLGFMSFCPKMANGKIGLAYRHSEMTMLLYPLLLGDKWTDVKKFFWNCGNTRSSLFGYKDAAWLLSLKDGLKKYRTMLNNMATALEDDRLFWSVLKWENKVNKW